MRIFKNSLQLNNSIIIIRMSSEVNFKYAKISFKKRQRLVQMVQQLKIPKSRAAEILHIKKSTAKAIVKRFEEEDTFFQSRNNRQKRLLEEKQKKQRSSAMEQNMEDQQINQSSNQAINQRTNMVSPVMNNYYLITQLAYPVVYQQPLNSWIFIYFQNTNLG